MAIHGRALGGSREAERNPSARISLSPLDLQASGTPRGPRAWLDVSWNSDIGFSLKWTPSLETAYCRSEDLGSVRKMRQSLGICGLPHSMSE
eukprot:6214016-Pleurochrysis_carterae.AAC.1